MKWYTPLGAVTVWEHSPSGEVLIADCRNPNIPLASQRVNARLAAAAPDLLAALREVRRCIVAHGLHGDATRVGYLEEAEDIIRAALARAS